MIPKSLTITLTGRAPVTIVRADWPIIARAKREVVEVTGIHAHYDLFVRQHADGRAVIYGVRYYRRQPRAGRFGIFLAAGADLAPWIIRVAHETASTAVFAQDLAQACIARLPAEPLL